LPSSVLVVAASTLIFRRTIIIHQKFRTLCWDWIIYRCVHRSPSGWLIYLRIRISNEKYRYLTYRKKRIHSVSEKSIDSKYQRKKSRHMYKSHILELFHFLRNSFYIYIYLIINENVTFFIIKFLTFYLTIENDWNTVFVNYH